jgi:hypothetical protein
MAESSYLEERVIRLGDCLLWVSVFNITEVAQIVRLLFPRLRFRINFDKKMGRASFGENFHQLIWSPCLRSKFLVQEKLPRLVWLVNVYIQFCCLYFGCQIRTIILKYNNVAQISQCVDSSPSNRQIMKKTSCTQAVAAWSSGSVSACHRENRRYGSWDRIPPGYRVEAF